jgi:hypothetical protein
LRYVSNSGRFDRDIALGFRRGEAFAAPRRADGDATRWRVATTTSTQWPADRVRTDTPVADDGAMALAETVRSGIAERVFEVRETGYQVIAAASAGQVRMWIDGKRVIDLDGQGKRRQRVFLAPLAPGRHLLRMAFVRPSKDVGVDVTVVAYGDGRGRWWEGPATQLELH